MNKHALALLVTVASTLTVTANSASANIAIGLSESINGVEGAITTVVNNVANVAVFNGSNKSRVHASAATCPESWSTLTRAKATLL